MGRNIKNPHSTSSLDRAPMERGVVGGVTIGEIEARVSELFPVASFEAMRAYSLLFAILKEGTSLQKLQWFTLYDMDFISQRVEALRSAGFLYTGTLSTQYVLRQLPGSENLIERITGQRIVTETITHRAPVGYPWEKNLQAPPIAPPAPPVANTNGKEKPMNTAINGAADTEDLQTPAQQTCEKSTSCGKPANHMGRCKGEGGSADRTRRQKQADSQKRKAPKAKSSKPKPTNGRKPQPAPALTATATAAAIDPGYFKIEFEDGEDTIIREGHGREGFARALKALYQEFAGVSNG